MRPRYRYIQFRVVSQKRRSRSEVFEAIQRTTVSTYGVSGFAEILPTLQSFDEDTQEGTLRCTRLRVVEMRASLSLIHEIRGDKTAFHVTGLSGTIKALGVHQKT